MGMEEGGIDLQFLKMGNEVTVGSTRDEKVSKIVIMLDDESRMCHDQFMSFASKILTLINEEKKQWNQWEQEKKMNLEKSDD